MRRHQAIIFDFGGVIGHFSHRRGAEQIAALTGGRLTTDQVYDGIFLSALEEQFDRGDFTPREFLGQLRQRFAISASEETLVRAWSDIFWRNEEVIAVIRRLPRALRLVLASNTNRLHYNHFRRSFADVMDLFDARILSFEVRRRKPDPEFFTHCIEATGQPASACIYVDDIPSYVDAARRLEIDSLTYHPGLDLVREFAERNIDLQAGTEEPCGQM